MKTVLLFKRKNNVPCYPIVGFSQVENEQIASDEEIMSISKRFLAKNKQAYEVLAKCQK